jgi:hypothetical protein
MSLIEEGVFIVKKENLFTNKKILLACAILLITGVCIVFTYYLINSNEKNVKFSIEKDESLPVEIMTDIIPEYRTLERALACVVDDTVYVVVTRGEKPSTGYSVVIDKMSVEENGDKSKLIVYANYKDPNKANAISQIITYPISVAKTNLKKLPTSIELRIQY